MIDTKSDSWRPTWDNLLDTIGTAWTPWEEIPEKWEKVRPATYEQGYYHLFGVLPERLPREFRQYLKDVVERNRGHMRRSNLRALVEGKIPGVPFPLPRTRLNTGDEVLALTGSKKKIDQILFFMDLVETIVFDKISEMSQQVEDADKLLGTPDPVKPPKNNKYRKKK